MMDTDDNKSEEDSIDTELRSQQFTEKGREYHCQLKSNELSKSFRSLKLLSERINCLLAENPVPSSVRALYIEWTISYGDFLRVNDEYIALLDDSAREDYLINVCDPRDIFLKNFKFATENWFLRTEVTFDTVVENDTGLHSVKSTSSKHSSRVSNTSSARDASIISARIKQEQKKAEISAKMASLARSHELELSKHELELSKLKIELQEKELDLNTQLAIANAKSKVLDNLEQIDDKDLVNTPNQIEIKPFIDPVEYKPCKTTLTNPIVSSDLNPQIKPFVPIGSEMRTNMTHNHSSSNNPVIGHEMPRYAMNTAFTGPSHNAANYGHTDSAMVSIIHQLGRPVPETKCFGGDPTEYRKFLRQFQTKVVANTNNYDDRINYLEQFTVGEPNRVIAGYSHLKAEQGYPAALQELEDRYGDSEIIANAYIKKAMQWSPIRIDDVKSLDEFAIFLTECKNAIACIDAMKILEFPDNLKLLISKLPIHYHDRWRNRVYSIKQVRQPVTFDHLVQFVKDEAKKVNDPTWGREAFSSLFKGKSQKGLDAKPTQKWNRSSFATCELEGKTTDSTSGNVTDYRSSGISGDNGEKPATPNTSKVCSYCRSPSHFLDKCDRFGKVPVTDRFTYLRKIGLCFGCLKPGHRKQDCRGLLTCNVCNKRHPTVLHYSLTLQKETGKTVGTTLINDKESSVSPPDKGICGHIGAGEEGVCAMAIIPVRVKLKNKMHAIETYAFLDTGSSVSFCTESLMNKLGAHGKQMKIKLDTMGMPYNMNTYAVLGLQVCGLQNDEMIDLPRVYAKDKMPVSSVHIPVQEDIDHWPHLRDIKLSKIDGEIGLMLGSNVPDAYTPLQIKTGPRRSPHATETLLGWIIWNVIRKNGDNHIQGLVNRTEIQAIEEVEDTLQLEKMLKESVGFDFPERSIDDRKEDSQEDKRFLEQVESSAQKVDGHYCIGLPFKNHEMKMPNNFSQARQRLVSLKKKMKANPKFYADYVTFMDKLVDSGYAEQVPLEESNRDDGHVWFLPHHGVYHPRKPEKIRVVFDASATYLGVSLNSQLLQGPDLTNNLLGVILRFRQDYFAIMGDIEAMFHQVRLPKEDSDCVRFLWWPNGILDGDPVQFRMLVHLFGAISSPSCANFALRKTVTDNQEQFSSGTLNVITKSMYVDDCLTSVATEEEAIHLIEDVSLLCEKGGFHLTKWTSNNQAVVESVPPGGRANDGEEFNLERNTIPCERALGMYWIAESDLLGFKIQIKDRPMTKRGILSIVSSVYDPIGLAAPFVLVGKILLQKACQTSMGWDEEICGKDASKWSEWLLELPQLEQLVIPRCYKPANFGRIISCQLHCFSDASDVGYGIVVYLRLVNENQEVHCSFVIGKARVAPLKKITVPRLELTAATMGVRICKLIKDELEYNIDQTFFWTDSITVLRYIWSESARFHTFVANRVAVIREASDMICWRYVETNLNPADSASRGMPCNKFMQYHHWWRGPDFLWKSDSEWPKLPEGSRVVPEEDVEMKKTVNVAVVEEPNKVMDRLLSYFSDWTRLKRIVAWILKAIENLQHCVAESKKMIESVSKVDCEPVERSRKIEEAILALRKMRLLKAQKSSKSVFLTANEVDKAERRIVHYVQHQHFDEVFKTLTIQNLETRKNLPKSSPLYKLDPFVDDGVIRVGGRLERASISYEAKHPVVIPSRSPVAKMILEHTHRRVGHLGKNSMLSAVRQKYWIMGATSLTRSVIAKCVVCRKYQAPVLEQKMANLPSERLNPDEPPFSKVGMDYFGPFSIKRGRSVVKRYGVIFTCLTIRAVHIEVAHSLDTDSCINAIRRFISRRGPIKYIRSDNGTNLVGAKREMQEEIQRWNSTKIGDVCSQKGIQWHFNPPSASHFGGVWERLIRTVRKVLYSVMCEQVIKLDDEGLVTLFCEVEEILNGRPITELPNSPHDLEALTPNHLLLLRPGEHFPPGNFDVKDNYGRRRWRQIQYLADLFWSRWIKEYLPLLQQRQKWFRPRDNLNIGDIVLVTDNTPRNSWCLARVLKVIKDKYGLVRAAEVKTKTSTLVRPIAKLCLILESALNDSSE